jgi:hypothetical protein
MPLKEVSPMRKLLIPVAVLAGIAALLAAWVRNTRLGAGLANERVNPYLVRRGIAGSGRSEIGTLEHVGRRSGIRRLTPLHPVPTETGFRFVVPLGERSEWVKNVMAAGHCRMQLHDTVYELDEPVLLAAGETGEVPAPVAWFLDRLGVQYLLLRRFAEGPGTLDQPAGEKQPSAGSPTVSGAHAEADAVAAAAD